jgi:hypothetical protein
MGDQNRRLGRLPHGSIQNPDPLIADGMIPIMLHYTADIWAACLPK